MQYPTIPRWVLSGLLAVGVVLLAAAATSGALAALVGLLGDSAASRGLGWAALGLAAALVTDLICLVFAVTLHILAHPAPVEEFQKGAGQQGSLFQEEPGP